MYSQNFFSVRSATRLVSYGADDVDEDEDAEGDAAAAEEPKKPGGSDDESPDRPEVCIHFIVIVTQPHLVTHMCVVDFPKYVICNYGIVKSCNILFCGLQFVE